MRQQYRIEPEKLTAEGFAPFGRAILPPQLPPDATGKGWVCWAPLGNLDESKPIIGIVVTEPTDRIISAMEREQKTEFLLPITGPIIQVVAPPSDRVNLSEMPNAATARAFIIQPGEAVIMAPGTWHCAALPLGSEALYYFIVEPRVPQSDPESSPWISFRDASTVQVVTKSLTL